MLHRLFPFGFHSFAILFEIHIRYYFFRSYIRPSSHLMKEDLFHVLRKLRPEVLHSHTASGFEAVDLPGQCSPITLSVHFLILGEGLRGGTVIFTAGFNSEGPATTFGVSRGFGAGMPPTVPALAQAQLLATGRVRVRASKRASPRAQALPSR